MSELPFPNPKATLTRFGLRPKKSFGQNFLGDANLVERIAKELEPGMRVIEIGAGLGALTTALLNRGHYVVAIERDREMLPVLQELLAEPIAAGRLTLLEADAKTVDYEHWLASAPGPWALVGNLPYNLTGALLQRATELAPLLARAVFLVQLEVAERLAAPADGDAYGALSVYAQAAFRVQRSFLVRRGAFVPQPNVDSAIVRMDPLTPPRARETDTFRAVVDAAFQQRRKTLRNAWRGLGLTSEALEELANRSGISLSARGETLNVEDFARASQALEDLRRAAAASQSELARGPREV